MLCHGHHLSVLKSDVYATVCDLFNCFHCSVIYRYIKTTTLDVHFKQCHSVVVFKLFSWKQTLFVRCFK